MRLGKQIFDKRESLPDENSRSLNGRGASNTPCPAQAASSAAAYDEKCNGWVVSGACIFSARQTCGQAMSLTPGLSSVCSSHQDRSVGRALAAMVGAAASTNCTS